MKGSIYTFVILLLFSLLCGCQSNKKNKPSYSAQEVQEALLAYNKRLAEKIHAEIDTFVLKSEREFEKTDDGFYYTVLKSTNANYPKVGDKVWCKLTFKLMDGSICYPEKSGDISEFIVGKHGLPIVNSAVQKVAKGGEIEVVVSPYLGFGLNGDGKKIPPARSYLLNVSLLEINNGALK